MSEVTKPAVIRGGGVATADGYLFELTGGELCLDFANTVDSRPTEKRRDLLPGYEDLIAWSMQAGILSESESDTLRSAARLNVEAAGATVEGARALREAVFDVFSAVANGTSPSPTALDMLNQFLSAAYERMRLLPDGSSFRLGLELDDTLDRVLWPVVLSAVELLTSDRLGRVRECAAQECRWLFLDQSRNRSRRWCDMTVCGNRAKVRRFRHAHGVSS